MDWLWRMSKPNNEKISTSGSQGGMGNPFGNLELGNLPSGPAETPGKPHESKLGRLHIRKEKAHRGGKTVTVVFGFEENVPLDRIEELARKLRNACGCGGTVRDRTIEIQGEQEERVRELLEAWRLPER